MKSVGSTPFIQYIFTEHKLCARCWGYSSEQIPTSGSVALSCEWRQAVNPEAQ